MSIRINSSQAAQRLQAPVDISTSIARSHSYDVPDLKVPVNGEATGMCWRGTRTFETPVGRKTAACTLVIGDAGSETDRAGYQSTGRGVENTIRWGVIPSVRWLPNRNLNGREGHDAALPLH